MAFKNLHTIISEIVTAFDLGFSVYFMHEKENRAFEILTEKNLTTLKYSKYPLVLLIHPFNEDKTKLGDYIADFRIAIVTHTEQKYYSDDRYTNNFDAILTPIYDALIDGMCQSSNIWTSNPKKIQYTKIDQLFIYGNKMPDKLDGIVLDFKNVVIVNSKTCEPVEITQFDLTMSSSTGGTIYPTAGTYLKNTGTITPIHAIASSGYRFVQWLINGIANLTALTYVTADRANTVIASFIKQWLVTTSVDGAGTITPSSGLTDEGNITITVTPTDPLTYEFEKIEITPDGESTQTVTTNPYTWTLNKAVVIVGYIKSILPDFTLTVTKTGNGTVTPDVGEHVYEQGTEVTITATETDDDYFFEAFEEIGQPDVTDNPYSVTMAGDKSINAKFTQLTRIMDAFGSYPQLISGSWVWPDASGFGNHLPITKSYRLNLNGSCYDFVPHSTPLVIGTSDFTILFKVKIVTGGAVMFFKRAAADATYIQCTHNLASNYLDFRVGNASAILTNQSTSVHTVSPGDTLHVAITRSGNSATLWINGVNLKTITSVPASINPTEGLGIGVWKYGSTTNFGGASEMEYFIFDKRKWTDAEIISLQTNYELPTTAPTLAKIYVEGGGGVAYDVSCNSLNGTVTNQSWIQTGDWPYHYIKGFTLSGSVIIPALMSGLTDAQGNTIQYPANSGIISGVVNEYLIPTNADLNEQIPAGEKTWAQIDALTESKYLIKTETDDQITNLVVKKKMSNSLSNYTRSTNYNRLTSYIR